MLLYIISSDHYGLLMSSTTGRVKLYGNTEYVIEMMLNIDKDQPYFSKFMIATGKWSTIYIEGRICQRNLSFPRMH